MGKSHSHTNLVPSLKSPMDNFQGPFEIKDTSLERGINITVQDFARQQDLEYRARYHDEPVWFIFRADGEVTHSVQVAAFRSLDASPDEAKLFLIPDARLIRKNDLQLLTLPEDRTEKVVLSEPLRSLKGLSADALRDKLYRLLGKAWETARKFKKHELTRSLGILAGSPDPKLH